MKIIQCNSKCLIHILKMFVNLHVGNFLYKGIDSRKTFICKTIVDVGRCPIKVIAKDILQKSNQVSL